MNKMKLKHPDGKFVHKGDDGALFLQNGEETAYEFTLDEFRKSSKYVKEEKHYKKNNLKYSTTDKNFIWNGGDVMEVVIPEESLAIAKEGENHPQKIGDLPNEEIHPVSEENSLKQKLQDWAFKGDDFEEIDGFESNGELLYAQCPKESEQPFLIARRIEMKKMIQFRAYVPTEEVEAAFEIIRELFPENGWMGVLL